jgi:hypothetical protein
LARADFSTRKIGGQMVNGHIFLIKRNQLNSNRQAPGRKRIIIEITTIEEPVTTHKKISFVWEGADFLR